MFLTNTPDNSGQHRIQESFMAEEGNIFSPVIPYTVANEELVLSLLDRYIDVTGISFGGLADTFYKYTPDQSSDLKFHGRQVSFYMKRERSIDPKYWYGISGFVYSEEFIETLPEARIVLRQQESTIEAGVYYGKLNGLATQLTEYAHFPYQLTGYWGGEFSTYLFFKHIKGQTFGIIHARAMNSHRLWSGFLFPHRLKAPNFEDHAYDVYLWDRLSRKKIVSELPQFYFVSSSKLPSFVTELSIDPLLVEKNKEYTGKRIREVMKGVDRDEFNEYVGIQESERSLQLGFTPFSQLGSKETPFQIIAEHDNWDKSIKEEKYNEISNFKHFIDNNLWGVIADGASISKS